MLQAHLWQEELKAEYTLRQQQHPDAAAWLPGLAEQLALMDELKEEFRSRFSAAQSVTALLSTEAKFAEEAHQDPSTFVPEDRPETSSADAAAEQLSRKSAFPGNASPATAADTLSMATSPSELTPMDEGHHQQPPPWTETPLSMPSRGVFPPVGAMPSSSDSVVGPEAGQLDVSAPKQGIPAPLRTPPCTRLPGVGSSAYTQQGLQTVHDSFVIMPASDDQLPSVLKSMVAGMEEFKLHVPAVQHVSQHTNAHQDINARAADVF